jgi:D-3-phosphoglycerate dehydrogenase
METRGNLLLKNFVVLMLRFYVTTLNRSVGDENCKQVSLEELKKKADVVSIHVPQTALTEKMINTSLIKSFTNNFWLINTARGKSVVTEDLVLGLKSGKILGAGLDVLEYEKSSFENLFSENLMPDAFKHLVT